MQGLNGTPDPVDESSRDSAGTNNRYYEEPPIYRTETASNLYHRTESVLATSFNAYRTSLIRIAVSLIVLGVFFVDPALAESNTQSNIICDADKLPSMIEGFFQLTTGLGIIGLAVVYQADSLIEMFTLNPEQKKGLKRHKRSAMKSTTVLIILGPLYTVAGSMMGLPLANCVNLVPW